MSVGMPDAGWRILGFGAHDDIAAKIQDSLRKAGLRSTNFALRDDEESDARLKSAPLKTPTTQSPSAASSTARMQMPIRPRSRRRHGLTGSSTSSMSKRRRPASFWYAVHKTP